MEITNVGSGFNNGGASAANPPSNGTATSPQSSAASKLDSDSQTFAQDLKGGADNKTLKNDATQVLGDYQQAKNAGVNPDKAGSLEDIQKLLEQLVGKGDSAQAPSGGSGGGSPAGGSSQGTGKSFEDVLKMFIKALEENGQNGAQGPGSAQQGGQGGQGQQSATGQQPPQQIAPQ